MPYTKQNNEIEHINKEISLLQDRLKINEKSLNQFQNGLLQIGRLRVKQGQRTNLSKTKKIQNILKNILKIRLFETGLKKIAKMQNLSQNEFNQIAEMRSQSLDELEQIAKTRRIKGYEETTKEELISL